MTHIFPPLWENRQLPADGCGVNNPQWQAILEDPDLLELLGSGEQYVSLLCVLHTSPLREGGAFVRMPKRMVVHGSRVCMCAGVYM